MAAAGSAAFATRQELGGGEHEEPAHRIHVPRLARRDGAVVGLGDGAIRVGHPGRPPTIARRPIGSCSVPNDVRASTSTPSGASNAGTRAVSVMTLS